MKINFASAISALVSASLAIFTDYRYSENKHIGSRYTSTLHTQSYITEFEKSAKQQRK